MSDNNATIKGVLKLIKDTQIITPSFQKREFVVTTNSQYPQNILIEFTQDKCSELDKAKVGQEVQVEVNILGREWINQQGETKFFNTLQAWRISSVGTMNNFDNDLPV